MAVAEGALRLTVQVVLPKDISEDGEQAIPLRLTSGDTGTVVVLVSPFHAADTVAEEGTVTEDAVVIKLADADPAGTVTDAGTGKTFPDVRPIAAAVGEAPLSVTVHVVLPKENTGDGEQLTLLSDTSGAIDTLVLTVTPFHVADTVAEEATVNDAAVAVKFAEEDPPGIVTEAGTDKLLPDVKPTVAADVDAPLRLTVHVVVPDEGIEDGEQLRLLSRITGVTETLALTVTPFHVADTVADEATTTEAAVAVKLADDDPAGIVIEDGTGKELPDVRPTVAADGDAPLRLTLQVVVPDEIIEDGEQLTPLRVTTGEIDTLVVLVTPVKAAEMVTGVTAETDPAVAVKADEIDPTGIVMEDGTGNAAELDERAMAALL